jgi:hypothetical protein
MISFKGFVQLNEGGNVKLKTGETAVPIKITSKNRPDIQKHTHEMLHALHLSFHGEHKAHLFGKDAKALHSGSAYSGSTKTLMHKDITHGEFAKHKKQTGDFDVKIPHEHMENLHKHLTPGRKFGKYTVVGVKSSGGEHHAIMKHENGEHHQVDFEKSTYHKDEPSHFDQFAHSADWNDTKHGIKGVHHKQLINAAGTDHHKFSSLHGLASRKEKDPHWEKDTHKITHKLFGPKADEQHLHSFHGVTHLIKHHIPKSEHQAIYDKFKKDVATSNKHIDNTAAVAHLKRELGTKD